MHCVPHSSCDNCASTSRATQEAQLQKARSPLQHPSPPQSPPTDTHARQALELARDTLDVALATGPRGALRAFQASALNPPSSTQSFSTPELRHLHEPSRSVPQGFNAVANVSREVLQELSSARGPPPSAPSVLRRLFEQLGPTYVKLGQFIASSPTLFPEASRALRRSAAAWAPAPGRSLSTGPEPRPRRRRSTCSSSRSAWTALRRFRST